MFQTLKLTPTMKATITSITQKHTILSIAQMANFTVGKIIRTLFLLEIRSILDFYTLGKAFFRPKLDIRILLSIDRTCVYFLFSDIKQSELNNITRRE